MTEQEFTYLRELIYTKAGLALSAEKRYLAESRLGPVCRRFGLQSLSELIKSAQAGDAVRVVAIIEAMTTNETLFFRDNTPFQNFRDFILPSLIEMRAGERTLRIWCAAASSGQEPYSLAMIIDDFADRLTGWKVDILATDISAEVLDKARAGLFSQFEVQRGLPVQLLLKHFTQEGQRWRLSDRLRRMVTFKEHNLIGETGWPGNVDLIMCRNVLIYFDLPTKSYVLKMLARNVRPDGFLMLGAAETVMGLTEAFTQEREHRGIYRPYGSRPLVAPAIEKPARENTPMLAQRAV